jgi:hypothetical protein
VIPNNRLSSSQVVQAFLPPDDLFDYCVPIVDYERGGVGLNNPSQGLNVQTWRLRWFRGDFLIDSTSNPAVGTQLLFSTEGSVSEVGLAFDQNMAPSVAYVEDGIGKFRWYDTNLLAWVTTILGSGVRSPRAALDDKRTRQTLLSDILLFYIRDGSLYYRQQRDRFDVERFLRETDAIAIGRAGMTVGLRVQIELIYPPDYDFPDICGFESIDGATAGQIYTSNEVILQAHVPLGATLSIDGGEYRYRWNTSADWGPWGSGDRLVSPDGVVQLRGAAPASVTVTIGETVCQWIVSTAPPPEP